MRPGDLVWAWNTWDIGAEPVRRLAVLLCDREEHVKVLADGGTRWVIRRFVEELDLKALTGNGATGS